MALFLLKRFGMCHSQLSINSQRSRYKVPILLLQCFIASYFCAYKKGSGQFWCDQIKNSLFSSLFIMPHWHPLSIRTELETLPKFSSDTSLCLAQTDQPPSLLDTVLWAMSVWNHLGNFWSKCFSYNLVCSWQGCNANTAEVLQRAWMMVNYESRPCGEASRTILLGLKGRYILYHAPCDAHIYRNRHWICDVQQSYQQYKCTSISCSNCIRSYCAWYPGGWMCSTCHVRHFIEEQQGGNWVS